MDHVINMLNYRSPSPAAHSHPPLRATCHPSRPRLETKEEPELSMVVRYFMRFGAEEGRDGLTLQVSIAFFALGNSV